MLAIAAYFLDTVALEWLLDRVGWDLRSLRPEDLPFENPRAWRECRDVTHRLSEVVVLCFLFPLLGVIVVEGRGLLGAFGRSLRLTAGNRWSIVRLALFLEFLGWSGWQISRGLYKLRLAITDRDILLAAELALPHRMKKQPFQESVMSPEQLENNMRRARAEAEEAFGEEDEADSEAEGSASADEKKASRAMNQS